MKAILASFLSGMVFAIGLGIGGMTQPAKVIGFLDFAGNWDPSLAFVMIGAIGVYFYFYRAVRNRPSPLFSSRFSIPTRTDMEPRLVGGAAIFGLGWGIAGYCPGPALTSLGSGSLSPVIFSVGMVAGMLFHNFLGGKKLLRHGDATPPGEVSTDT